MSENAKIQHPCELFLSNCHKPDGVLDKVEIHISKSCNIACPWCYGKFLASKERNMPMMTFRKLIDSLDKINPLITIAGLYTDPLTHPDINGFVHYIGCYGYRFALYTNGFLLNDDLNRELERAASCNRTDRPSYISINACKYEEDEDFARIRALCARKKDLLVTANLIPNYVRNLRHTIKELHAAGVDVIRLSMQ
jgi:MoaA/NifB/PqqE/SkfB family radical SAM enzyme